jgi:hypothetical protein
MSAISYIMAPVGFLVSGGFWKLAYEAIARVRVGAINSGFRKPVETGNPRAGILPANIYFCPELQPLTCASGNSVTSVTWLPLHSVGLRWRLFSFAGAHSFV